MCYSCDRRRYRAYNEGFADKLGMLPIIASQVRGRKHSGPAGIREMTLWLCLPHMFELLNNVEMSQADQLAIAGGVTGAPILWNMPARRLPTP